MRGPRSSSDRPLQITPIDGLRHIVERAALQELPRFVFFVIAADDDDCRWLRASSQVIQYGMAVDAWHPNVEQHDVRSEHQYAMRRAQLLLLLASDACASSRWKSC